MSCLKQATFSLFQFFTFDIWNFQLNIKRIMAIPRGIRNHNPLNIRRSESHQARLNGRVSTDVDKVNIRRSKDQWKGLAEAQNDRAFCQFKSLEYGWRAAFYLLTRTYYHKYRLYTIRGIISRWAPSSENDTSAYIQNVSRLTGIDPDEPIGIPSDKPSRWMAVGVAMAIQENGTTSIDWFAMLKGWEMARSEV